MIGLLHVGSYRYDKRITSIETHKQAIVNVITSTMDKAADLLSTLKQPQSMFELIQEALAGDEVFQK